MSGNQSTRTWSNDKEKVESSSSSSTKDNVAKVVAVGATVAATVGVGVAAYAVTRPMDNNN